MDAMQWIWDASMNSFKQNLSNLTSSCPHNLTDPVHSAWVYLVFQECVFNLRQWFAFWIGLSSILLWLIAQVPQLVKNCRTGKADEALSFWFLLQWFLGDATNLIGAILSHQLPTQIATAVYFVIMDTLTMLQFLFYVVKNQGIKGLWNCCKLKKRSHSVLGALLPGVMFSVFVASHSPTLWTHPYQMKPRTGRTLKSDDYQYVVDVNDPEAVVGYVLGCISAIFYIMSRVPQIVKNCRRCSVEGLSPAMFALAVLGNVTYGLGIFLYSMDPVFLLQRLPWLVGSVGTLFFDFTILIQCALSLCQRCVGVSGDVESEGEKEPLLSHVTSTSESSIQTALARDKGRRNRRRSLSPDFKVEY